MRFGFRFLIDYFRNNVFKPRRPIKSLKSPRLTLVTWPTITFRKICALIPGINPRFAATLTTPSLWLTYLTFHQEAFPLFHVQQHLPTRLLSILEHLQWLTKVKCFPHISGDPKDVLQSSPQLHICLKGSIHYIVERLSQTITLRWRSIVHSQDASLQGR